MTWYINVVSYPNLKFDHSGTYITIGSKRTGPGTYTVRKGTTASFSFRATNTGGPGSVKIVVFDAKSGRTLFSREYSVSKGQSISDSGSFSVNSNMAVQFFAYVLKNGSWVKTDEYG